MFTTIFAFGVLVAHVTAELPSYIHACNLKDSNYDQCIANNINNVKHKICTGFSELDIPPMEPLKINKIVIFDTNHVKLYLKDIELYGICDFELQSVHADLERLHFDLNFLFSHIYINTTYDFDIRLLVPVANKGPVQITTGNRRVNINMDLKVITKNGTKHIFASKVKSKIYVGSFKYNFNKDKKDLAELHKIISDIVDNNEEEVTNAVLAGLEEAISKLIILLFNGIARSNYEELFLKET